MVNVDINTYKMNEYAQQLEQINYRVKQLEQRIDKFLEIFGIAADWILQPESMSQYAKLLVNCCLYLRDTSKDFDETERKLLEADASEWLQDFGTVSGSIFGIAQEVFGNHVFFNGVSDISEYIMNIINATAMSDTMTLGEVLGWIEEGYADEPHYLTHIAEVWLPSSLKDAYTFTSALFQGELTGEIVWDTAKSVLSKDTKLNIVCKAVDYALDRGAARVDELEAELMEQLKEGDILGAAFDGAEGFVDTIIGGAIEVAGAAAGKTVDKLFNNPLTENLNKGFEYITGVIGWNDGDGYSIGGLIGHATEKISDGIDIVTDAVSDAVNCVTDTITDWGKSAINWVKGWFS